MKVQLDENGDGIGTARYVVHPLPGLWTWRYRIYFDHQPENHMTVYYHRHLTRYLGSYTPPGWFLRLIGEIEGEAGLLQRTKDWLHRVHWSAIA